MAAAIQQRKEARHAHKGGRCRRLRNHDQLQLAEGKAVSQVAPEKKSNCIKREITDVPEMRIPAVPVSRLRIEMVREASTPPAKT